MQVAPGTRLGPYEILSRIGAGGMGEVWKARDTRLDRSVAVKVLPAELANSGNLKLRFEREAKAISQLNHPHICTLFDVGDNYLVMELLEGESLADRLARGALPLHEAIRYGAQIADALDRAHRAGIVHRDLKPGNVMITKSGAKLLDFGLAKPSGTGVAPDDATQVQRTLTEEGTIIGTFQYMAPEQLEGVEADARTDIFALGVVLYEMVTGKRAFAGKTRTSLIAAIVGSEPPPLREVLPLAPSALDHVVRTCMEKDPENRWQSAHDVANELLWIQSSATQELQPVPRSSKWAWIAAAVLALVAIGASALYLRERGRPVQPVAFSIMAPKGFTIVNAAVSPDGSAIAFLAEDGDRKQALFVRRVGNAEAAKLSDATGESTIIWSPDSSAIAYVGGGGKLMKVSADGGKPEIICDAKGYGVGGAWSRKGEILFAPAFAEGLYKVSAAGGDLVRVSTLDASQHETVHGFPVFLSDDDHFVFVRHTVGENANEIHAASLAGGPRKFVVKADALGGVWNGRLLFVRNGVLYAQRFDEKKLAVTGDPVKVIDDVAFDESWASAHVSVSRDGAIVFPPTSNGVRVEAGWYDEGGRLLQRLFTESNVRDMHLSRDDQRILLERRDPRKGAKHIVVYETARGVLTRLTSGLADNEAPAFSGDGATVYFSSDRQGMYDVFAQPDDGVGSARAVLRSNVDKHVTDISPDGRTMLMIASAPGTHDDVWVASTDGSHAAPWIASDAWEQSARFSPDGKWVTYQSNRSGRFEVYVAAFPNGRSVQVSVDGGRGPEFDSDGSHLIFANGERMLCSAEIHPAGGVVTVGRVVPMFQMPPSMISWWRSKTTKRFLCAVATDPRDMVSVFNYVRGALK